MARIKRETAYWVDEEGHKRAYPFWYYLLFASIVVGGIITIINA